MREIYKSPTVTGVATCNKLNRINVTQSADSMSTSQIAWYHHPKAIEGDKEVNKIFITKLEITLMFVGSDKHYVSDDDLVDKLNDMSLNE